MQRILIVEDDLSVARFLQQAADEAGYETRLVRDGLAAVQAARGGGEIDLILLDVMLPGLDGLSVCTRLRAEGARTPILMLTARDALEDKVRGLDCGADDYIVKPFALAELLARMRALLRRGVVSGPRRPESVGLLKAGDLVMDTDAHHVTRAGVAISLSVTEYALLEYLMRNAGRVATRSQILDHVWQYDFGGNDNVLDVYISYLRAKVDRGHAQPLIHTVRGVGYRLAAEPAGMSPQ